MCRDVGLGGFDQGFKPQSLTIRVFARLVFPHPILPDVEPQPVKSRLVAFQGMMDATFGLVQRQSDVRQPRHQQLLTMLQDLAVFMKHHHIIRIHHDAGFRVYLGDRLLHPMQGNQGQQWGNRPPLRRPCGGRKEMVIFQIPALSQALSCRRMTGDACVLTNKAS